MSLKTYQFGLNKWAAWGLGELSDGHHRISHISHGMPKLEGIAAMAKRRMPQMAKYIYHLIHELDHEDDQDIANIPTVFVTKNAELTRTFKLIRSFDKDVSPMQFSMSVHNAIAGLLSVITKNRGNYTVIDSLSGSLETALIEAISMLNNHQYVKIIYFDENLPEELKQTYPLEDKPIVLSLLIRKGNEFSISSHPNKDLNVKKTESFKQLAQLLNRQKTSYHSVTKRLKWHWHCNATS